MPLFLLDTNRKQRRYKPWVNVLHTRHRVVWTTYMNLCGIYYVTIGSSLCFYSCISNSSGYKNSRVFKWILSGPALPHSIYLCMEVLGFNGKIQSAKFSDDPRIRNEGWMILWVFLGAMEKIPYDSGWWFQPLWKILVKMGIFHK